MLKFAISRQKSTKNSDFWILRPSDFTIRFFVIGTDENLTLGTEIEKATHVWQASGIMLRKAMSKASGSEIK